VDGFFVLTGFLIANPIFKSENKQIQKVTTKITTKILLTLFI
jgi:hypothetical protein